MSGGKWNRQGRRSGGYRKVVIPVAVPQDKTVYRQCPECTKVVPPYDEKCEMCRVIRKLKEEGKIE
jgi:hypothetical protein